MSPTEALSRRVDAIEKSHSFRGKAILCLAVFWVVLFVGLGVFSIFSYLIQKQTQRAVNTPACSIQSWSTKRIHKLEQRIAHPGPKDDIAALRAAVTDYRFLRRSFKTVPADYNCAPLLAKLRKEDP